MLFCAYKFTARTVYGILLPRVNKISKTGSGVIVDTPDHEVSWLQDNPFASIVTCEAEWLEHGGALGLGGGSKVVFVDQPALDDLKLLFESDAGWTKDVGPTKLKLQKVWGLLTDVLPGLPMTYPTDSLELVKSGHEVIKKNKFLFEEFEALWKTVTDEKVSREGVQK